MKHVYSFVCVCAYCLRPYDFVKLFYVILDFDTFSSEAGSKPTIPGIHELAQNILPVVDTFSKKNSFDFVIRGSDP